MKVTKDGNTFDVSGVQIRVFLNSGYETVKEEPKDEKPKGKGAKKPEEPKDEKK